MPTDTEIHPVLRARCCVCELEMPEATADQGLAIVLSDNPAMYEGGEEVTAPTKFICDPCVKRVLMLVGDPRRPI